MQGLHHLSPQRDHRLGSDSMSQEGSDWQPTHRHRKGGLYRKIAEAVYEPDRSAVILYDEADGTIWVRPKSEFEDGRFEAL